MATCPCGTITCSHECEATTASAVLEAYAEEQGKSYHCCCMCVCAWLCVCVEGETYPQKMTQH